MPKKKLFNDLLQRVIDHLSLIYPGHNQEQLARRLLETMDLMEVQHKPRWYRNNWSEKDVAVITYANSVVKDGEVPLATLSRFLNKYLHGTINWVHILPFFPYSSDDGFAVIDYTQVNESFGTWKHVERIAKKFKLMADLVINHCSSMSRWFEQFKQSKEPGKHYFMEVDPTADTSSVVRPRTSPLLREVQTLEGVRHVWCTFSHDQPDLNFRNPDVLMEMVGIIKGYLDRGVRIIRLDAVAFLWKDLNTNCINLDQTHEVVRLIRTLVEYYKPGTVIITETNIPNIENISYFGNANEAHIIYNFSLPPLLLNTMVTGNCHALKSWLMGMPPAQMGTTFFNFLASHDGIGLRPLEGLLSEEEIAHLIALMEHNGGLVSWRTSGSEVKPYEINITLFDALKGTVANHDDGWQEQRFICAHAIMLTIEGLPAFYIHSLLSTENDYQKFANTNNNRAINRHTWQLKDLEEVLAGDNIHARIFRELMRLIAIRRQQKAFHPNAIIFTLHLGDEVFGNWRQSIDRQQSIFCINNITAGPQQVLLSSINLIATDSWVDLISGEEIQKKQEVLELQPYQSVWLVNKSSLKPRQKK